MAVRLLVSPPSWLTAWATAHNSVPSPASLRPSSNCLLSWTDLIIASFAAWSQRASRLARNARPSTPAIGDGVLRRSSRYFPSRSWSSWLSSSRALLISAITVLLLLFWKASSSTRL